MSKKPEIFFNLAKLQLMNSRLCHPCFVDRNPKLLGTISYLFLRLLLGSENRYKNLASI